MLTNLYGVSSTLLCDAFSSKQHTSSCRVKELDQEAVIELVVPRYRVADVTVTADAATGRITVSGVLPTSPRSSTLHKASSSSSFALAKSASSSSLLSTAESDRNTCCGAGAAHYGKFHRSFTFPPTVYEVAKYQASVKACVLRVSVPKRSSVSDAAAEVAPSHMPVTTAAAVDVAPVVVSAQSCVCVPQAAPRWPPAVHRDMSESCLTYTIEAPDHVSRENVSLDKSQKESEGETILLLTVTCPLQSNAVVGILSQQLRYRVELQVPRHFGVAACETRVESGVITVRIERDNE